MNLTTHTCTLFTNESHTLSTNDSNFQILCWNSYGAYIREENIWLISYNKIFIEYYYKTGNIITIV
jgi:hypothetical protein